jgi:hypothetical protein
MPALACVNDMFPTTTGSLPTWVLPIIPNVSPYDPSSNPLNTYGPYQPNQLAMVCIAQQGWTSVGTMDGSMSSRPIKAQWWVKVIDEADIRVSGP